VRNEIALVLLHQFGTIPGHRLVGFKLLARIPNSRNEFAVCDAFNVKGQIRNAGIGHAAPCSSKTVRCVSPNVPETSPPRKYSDPTGLEVSVEVLRLAVL